MDMTYASAHVTVVGGGGGGLSGPSGQQAGGTGGVGGGGPGAPGGAGHAYRPLLRLFAGTRNLAVRLLAEGTLLTPSGPPAHFAGCRCPGAPPGPAPGLGVVWILLSQGF